MIKVIVVTYPQSTNSGLNHLVPTFIQLIPGELYFYFSSSLFIVTFGSISADILIPACTMNGTLAAVPSSLLVL